jgi:hypothetical protein
LVIEAGDRLTTIRCVGMATPAADAADRMRSGACPQALSGSPETAIVGRPEAMCASTSTSVPATPANATARV